MNFSDQVRSQFDQIVAQSKTGGEKTFREKAWFEFSRLGLPHRKTESWKYTSIAPLTKTSWNLAQVQSAVSAQVEGLAAKWRDQFEIVFLLNGVLRTEHSTLTSDHLKVTALEDLELEFEDGWIGLSAAMARPGFRLGFPDNFQASKPVLIVNAMSEPSTWTPVVHGISLGKNSSLQLAEIQVGEGSRYLRSEITQVELAEGARLDWVRVQQDDLSAFHFSEVQSRLQQNSALSVTQLNGGAAWSRSTLRAQIDGVGAEAHLNGLTFARQQQHIDQRVEIKHLTGPSESSQLFKGVLKDKAKGILNGKIYIAQDAQKVSSMQMNHNLLLSPTAEANTKPELEIYADDVKANHGASIGQLDEDKIFYFMSRGITRTVAQQMLAHAFVGDVVMKIQSKALRSFADQCIQSWLPEFSADIEHTLEERA